MFCYSEAICVNFEEKRMTFMHIYAYATAVHGVMGLWTKVIWSRPL